MTTQIDYEGVLARINQAHTEVVRAVAVLDSVARELLGELHRREQLEREHDAAKHASAKEVPDDGQGD